MTQQILTIAIAKGYLFSESIKLLRKIGYKFEKTEYEDSRKLFIFDKSKTIRLLIIRPWDVSLYVEHGAADLGIVGKDVLLEKAEDVLELMDLKFGKCGLVLASAKKNVPSHLYHNINVATKYPNSTEKYFAALGIKANILKMYGAVELAPITNTADIICDLTASGQTLKENKLKIIDTVFTSSARLIANPVSFKVFYKEIIELAAKINKKL